MNIIEMHRQGDVGIIKVSEIPNVFSKEAKRDNGRVILAYGEVTGHAHAIHETKVKSYVTEDGELALTSDFLDDAAGFVTMALEVQEDVVDLVHEEHDTLTLTKGKYIIMQQREYSPEALRNVLD